MRILVTGGSGYIGTRLLLALGARPGVEEMVNVDIRPPREALPRVRFVERSVTEDLRDLFRDRARPIDVAMHLAWVVDPMRDRARQRAICMGGSERFLEGCAAGDVRHVFFMSSGTAYGAHPDHREPLAESAPLRPEFHFQYSAEKREAEALFVLFAAARPGTLVQLARPCVVGGPHVANFIFRAMDRPLNVRVLGHDPGVQLVHEDDVAAALVAIVESRKPGAFNVAGDGMMPMSACYRRLGARVLPLPMGVVRGLVGLAWRRGWRWLAEAPPEFVPFLAYPWPLSNRRIKEELGFRFRYTAEQTLDAYLAARRGGVTSTTAA